MDFLVKLMELGDEVGVLGFSLRGLLVFFE